MALTSFSAYLTDIQRDKLKLLADIEQVTASNWLGGRIDGAWSECYGPNCHPNMVANGRNAVVKKTIHAAGGSKRRVAA